MERPSVSVSIDAPARFSLMEKPVGLGVVVAALLVFWGLANSLSSTDNLSTEDQFAELPPSNEPFSPQESSVSQPSEEITEGGDPAVGDVDKHVDQTQFQSFTLKRRETLSRLLQRAGVRSADAYAAISAIGEIADLRRLQPGQTVEVSFEPDSNSTAPNEVLSVLRLRDDFNSLAVASKASNGYTAARQTVPTRPKYEIAEGTIEDSLYLAARRAGAPHDVIAAVIRMMNYAVDFQRDIRPGDRFRIYYDQPYSPDYNELGSGRVLYAELKLWRGTFDAILYEDSDGNADYYDKDGESLRKSIMVTPIDGARLSSGFGKRKHPILGYTRLHKGLDFAAPRGTPIMAGGDGVVERANRYGSFGNYVRIRHGNGFKTVYAHLKGFARGIKKGARVKQGDTIGFVGTTGGSTGPHLHYEVIRDGRQVNPLRLDLPTARRLASTEMDRFAETLKGVEVEMRRLAGRDERQSTAAVSR